MLETVLSLLNASIFDQLTVAVLASLNIVGLVVSFKLAVAIFRRLSDSK